MNQILKNRPAETKDKSEKKDMPPEAVHIGTSGWSYKDWVGPFYPENTIEKDLLSQYAEIFHTVEVNNSFYSLPSKKSVESWVGETPEDFIFSCKASRYITHQKKLKDPDKTTSRFFQAIKPFGHKIGPILFQLPGKWKCNLDRLEKFLKTLPKDHRYAFEFRDQSWLCDDTYKLLEKHEASLCLYDYKQFTTPDISTADFIYIRLHGPEKTPYKGYYKRNVLRSWGQKILRWAKEGKAIYCYFDNDQKSCAPRDAQQLKTLYETMA